MRGPSAMTSSKKRGKYPYWVNTQLPAGPKDQDQRDDQHQPAYPHPATIPTLHPHAVSVHQTSSRVSQGKRNPVQRSSPIILYPSLGLAAAAMAGFRRRCRFAKVLRGIMIELLFAFGAAEVIRLSSVLGVSSGGGSVYLHAANGIFHDSGAAHWDLLGS
jgi:hypothetical protein